VPRDVESAVGDLENVYLYNIDDLQQLVAGARQARAAEIARAREMIESAVTDYQRWWRSLEAAPLIVAVREKLEAVRLGEAARLRSRLPGLSDKEWRAVEAAMQAITNKIAHPATFAIREAAGSEGGSAGLDAIRRAFGLEETVGESPEVAPAREARAPEGSGS
jgi:glutamyl-tRNA reductase